MKGKRPEEETPLAILVRARLAELGMKQSEFCRLTGFDQGLLSKIQSSMISKLTLETALRLAVGLSVPPRKIFELIGRPDLEGLIEKAYPRDRASPTDSEEPPVGEVRDLAMKAHAQGQNLNPVVDLLSEMISKPGGQSKKQSGGQ